MTDQAMNQAPAYPSVDEAVAYALRETKRPNADEAEELFIGAIVTGLITTIELGAAERLHYVGGETERKVIGVFNMFTEASNTMDTPAYYTIPSYAHPGEVLWQDTVHDYIAATHAMDYLLLRENGFGNQPGLDPEMLADAERAYALGDKNPDVRAAIDLLAALGAANILGGETDDMAASLTAKESEIRARAEALLHTFTHNPLSSMPGAGEIQHVLGRVGQAAVSSSPMLHEAKAKLTKIINGLNASTEGVRDYTAHVAHMALSKRLGTDKYPQGDETQIQYLLTGLAALGHEFVPANLTPEKCIEFSHALATRGVLRNPSEYFGSNVTDQNRRTVGECLKMAAMFDWKQAPGLSLTAAAAEAKVAQHAAAQAEQAAPEHQPQEQ